MGSRWYASLRLYRQAAIFSLLAGLVPAIARAQSSTCIAGVPSVCVYNAGGTATYASGSNGGLFMDGADGSAASTVYAINSLGGKGENLGTLSLTTGAFTPNAGNTHGLEGNGSFGNGTLTISNTVSFGGFTGTLFSGTLTNITWTANGKIGSQYEYTLQGVLTGTFEGNTQVSGTTVQMYFHSSTPWNGTGKISLSNGATTFIVPEPASMSLMGTGFMAIALLVRKRLRSR